MLLPDCFIRKLFYRKSWCEHVTPLLRELHWLWSRERFDFKLAVLIFWCLHGLALRYLADDIRRTADANRRHLHSSSSDLLTRPMWLVTMGDRAFKAVTGSWLLNTLPHDVTSAPTLPVFCNCRQKPSKVKFVQIFLSSKLIFFPRLSCQVSKMV